MNAQLGIFERNLISVDLFAGGGGASLAMEWATGSSPLIAVNHDPASIRMHKANHPETMHFCESVYDVDPIQSTQGLPVGFMWASPDCTQFSRAKAGKPVDSKIRGLAGVVVVWAAALLPKVLFVENVREFRDWGPLHPSDHPNEKLQDRPIKARKGEDFAKWVGELEALGYVVEHRVLNAADYGAPTARHRLFVVARRDGAPVVWPEPTHGPGRDHEHRAVAECIDWSLDCPSIFLTREEARGHRVRRPLAEKTLTRIAAGVQRYVVEDPERYLVGDENELAATMIQTGYGERPGQRPRYLDIRKPIGTLVAGGVKHAIISCWLAKHYGGVVGQSVRKPSGTITAIDHHALVNAGLEPVAEANRERARAVAAFMTTYYGQSVGQSLRAPLNTIVGRDRFGLVTVSLEGDEYAITDIGMRMLQPHELKVAQGFPEDYILTGNKTEKVGRIGNSVSPPVAAALISAQIHA